MPTGHATRRPSAHDLLDVDAPAQPPRWLSVKDISADLGISINTAYKWSARGEPWFPHSIRLRNGDLRVRRDWYEAWLADLDADQNGPTGRP